MFTKDFFITELKEIKTHLMQFLTHPIREIRNVPDWSWHRLGILFLLVTSICGVLSGLVSRLPIVAVIFSLISQPIISCIMLAISAAYFYYCFQIFCEKTVSLHKLCTIILFANIPGFFFGIGAGYVPPLVLIGMAFTALLLLVGFVENFQLERKKVIRIVGALYALFFAMWLFNKRESMRFDHDWNADSAVTAPEVKLGE